MAEQQDRLNTKKDEPEVLLPDANRLRYIKNKILRNKQYNQAKRDSKKASKKRKLERRESGQPKQIPHTIENKRLPDETVVGNLQSEENAVVREDLAGDEFANFYEKSYEPKVLITFCDNPTKKTRIFGKELTRMIPNSEYLYRNRSSVKKIVKGAIERKYSDILVINENRREPNGLLVIHLPDGPTAHFKLSNVKITTDLRKDHKHITSHRPEVVLNNFTTRLGYTIGRMLGALFHYDPEYEGQRVVTFHNQRDYIFFRHHRYEFVKSGNKARLHELGPRFTLKLRSLQKGTFDSKNGQYEWIIEGRRHALEFSRRKFYL